MRNIEDEIPFEIPDSWCWMRLGALIKIISGVSYDKKDVCDKGIRILRGGNISNLDITTFDNDVFLPTQYRDIEKQLQIGDIVIVASTGSKAVIGKAGYVKKQFPDTQIGAFLRIIRPLFSCLVNYIQLLFATEYYREHIRLQSQGTNINNIKAEYITQILLPIPSLAEQARIVTEIEKYEPLIAEYDKLEQQKTKLDSEMYDNLKKSILQYAIQGKLVPQDPNDEPASVLLELIRAEKKAKLGKKYVESYIYKDDDNCYYEHIGGEDIDITDEIPYDLPEGWQFERLGNIIEISSGKNTTSAEMSKTEQLFPVYGGNGITGHFNRYNVEENTIVIGRVGFYCGSIHITTMNSWITDNALIVNYDTSFILLRYMEYMLRWADFGRKSSSTAQPLVTGKIIKPFIIGIPPLAEQRRIVDKINEIFSKL